MARGFGHDVALLDAEAVRAELDSPTYLGGMWSTDTVAMVDPARLAWGLKQACVALGVRIHEHTPVTGLDPDPAVGLVAHAARRVRARRVALATNVFPSLLRRVRPYVVPVYDYVLVTEPLSPEPAGQHRLAGPARGRRQRQPVPLLPAHRRRPDPVGRLRRRLPLRQRPRRPPRPAAGDLRQAGRALRRHLPAAGAAAVHPQLGRGDRHLHPVLRVLGHGARRSGRLCRRLHRSRRRRHPVRRAGHARPAGRRAQRAHRARDGAPPAGAVPAGAVPLRRRPAHPLVAGPSGPTTRAGATCGCAPSTASASDSTVERVVHMRHITHWIDGKPFAGEASAGATSTTRRPAQVAGSVDFASVGRRRRRGRRGARRPSRPGGVVAGQPHPGAVRLPRAAQRAQGGDGRAHHRRARQGALRRARRGDPRPRGRRVRLRHPAPAQGRLLRERLDQGRRLLDPPAARRRRRHLAVQLPGHGPDVVRPDRDRRGQHRRAQAEREGPVGGAAAWPSCGPRPACPTACSTSCTATRWRSTGCWSTRTSRRSRFVGSTPIARYVYETGTAPRQAGAGARRREEPHGRAAGRRPRPRRRRRGQRRLRLGRRALHGDLGARRRRAGRRRAGREDRASGSRRLRTGDGRRGCDMGPLVTAQHRDKVAVLRRRRRRGRARRSSSTAATSSSTAPRTASGSARRCSTTSRPT